MKTYQLHTNYKQILADTITPVSVYLKIRDKFPNSILLESSDYHANDNSFSYICFNPIASIKVENNTIETNFPDRFSEITPIDSNVNVVKEIEKFSNQFLTEKSKSFSAAGARGRNHGFSSAGSRFRELWNSSRRLV